MTCKPKLSSDRLSPAEATDNEHCDAPTFEADPLDYAPWHPSLAIALFERVGRLDRMLPAC